jgi:anhydro-N-acetylmuramic acid kinase
VPAFHAAAFRSTDTERVILNIGGIANITILPCADKTPVTGFDTGPGNTLLDQWVRHELHLAFDQQGEWAASGRVIESLLEKLLADPYFAKAPPKSTGREYFNLRWLEQHIAQAGYLAQDVQATLLELTCQSIVQAIKAHAPNTSELYVCGGGAHNPPILERLSQLMSPAPVQTTSVLGIEPDWVEAAAFAWLAKQTMHKQAGNLMSVTGAKHPVILGGIYQADS